MLIDERSVTGDRPSVLPVAIYARYSTDKQDARSIEDQLRRCREHATRNGYEVVAEFQDAATSGSHLDRAGLQQMLSVMTALKRSPFRAVIVDDQSRLSRDIGDTHAIVFGALAGAGVKLLDTAGLDSEADSGEMTIAMRSVINREYIRGVSKMTHRGLDGRAREGFSTGGSLYGFHTHAEPNPRDKDHPKKLWAIDENEALIVRRVFRMVDEGIGYRGISDALNREGVPAPRNNGRGGKHGGGWSHVSVRAILTNPKYIGEWTWNETKWTRLPGKRTRRRSARPESEHVTRSYPELAIIDRATWNRVQARIAKRKRGLEKTTRKGQQTTLVSGLLRCGTCGGPLSVRSAKVKNGVRYVNYGCTAHSSRGGSICENGTTISEKKATQALIEALRDVLCGPSFNETFTKAFERRVGERSKIRSGVDLVKQLENAQRRVSNATRLIVEMPDDLDIRRQRDDDKSEVRRLTDAIAAGNAIQKAIPSRKAIGAAVDRFLAAVAGDPVGGREVLVRCVSAITVTPKINGPGRFELTGSVDLAQVAASGSSGGLTVPLAADGILLLTFARAA